MTRARATHKPSNKVLRFRGDPVQSSVTTQAAIDSLGTRYTGVSIDSRSVKSGDLFLAYPGDAADGRQYIAQAIAAGALIVAWEKSGFAWNPVWQVPNVAVDGLRHQAGHLAGNFFKNPSRHLWIAGVTGTNGKTTCSQWIAQSLNYLKRKSAVAGTLGRGLPGDDAFDRTSVNTTPDPVTLQAFLAQMRAKGAQAVAMEVSSHGIEQGRVNGIEIDVAMFTNLSRDHLDYHGDMHSYGEAKAQLFAWPGLKHAVVNLDDRFGAELASRIDRKKVNVIGYGFGKGEIAGHKLDMSRRGLKLEITTPWGAAHLRSRVLGAFNAHNILGVLGVLVCSDVPLEDAVAAIAEIEPVPGRMQTISESGFPLVVVDYCHTPEALAKALESLRGLLEPGARLHCVFGAGGDRDAGKRPEMGEVATRLADQSIVTSDNPRSEDPLRIIDDIVAGARGGYQLQPDRRKAISEAIRNAVPDDVVLIAGKGHEAYQEIQGQRIPFDDLAVAREVIARRSRPKRRQGGSACV